MRTLDLESLIIFRTVVEEGGVLRAAEKLHRVPSNVTTRIKQLEGFLGVRLFVRRGRTLTLSAEGASLLNYSIRLLRLADEAVSELRTGRPKGTFRLGSLESTAGSRLAPVLSRYHHENPEVVVELHTGTTGALLNRVVGYEIEAAFISEPFTSSEVETLGVFSEKLVLITPKSVQRVQAARDLRQRTMIAFARGCSYRKRLESWLGEDNVMPERVLELSSYQGMIACVAAGAGFAIAPESLLLTLDAARKVNQHKLPGRIAKNTTHIVWKGEPSLALTALITLLKEHVS